MEHPLVLPRMSMNNCLFQDVLGDFASVNKLVTLAQIGEAKRTVRRNFNVSDLRQLGAFGGELLVHYAKDNVQNLLDRRADLTFFDRYGFAKHKSLSRDVMLTKHRKQAMFCTSADAFWRQAMHLAFDWNTNNDIKSSAIVVVENHSSVPVEILSADAVVGKSEHFSRAAGQAPGCDISNTVLNPIGKGGWSSPSSSLVFAWGTRLSEVTCCIKAT